MNKPYISSIWLFRFDEPAALFSSKRVLCPPTGGCEITFKESKLRQELSKEAVNAIYKIVEQDIAKSMTNFSKEISDFTL